MPHQCHVLQDHLAYLLLLLDLFLMGRKKPLYLHVLLLRAELRPVPLLGSQNLSNRI
jgi:hypothetical protein